MTTQLPAPELPKGRYGYRMCHVGYFTADQMLAYAVQEVAAERERCAKLCEGSDVYEEYDPGGFFADLIRKQA